MDGRIEAIVIKTVYNNQGWKGRCKRPLKDYRCYMCVKGVLPGINGGNPVEEDKKGFCHGDFGSYAIPEDAWCWEQTLCAKYIWRNIKGKWRFATEGMPVFFVYPEHDKSLTLWGHTIIKRIDNDFELPTIHFKAFDPLPHEKWVHGLTGKELTGAHFKQGHYRYLDATHREYLASLIQGGKQSQKTSVVPTVEVDAGSINVQLREDIIRKLEKIANMEGREVRDIIREAVAKLIRERGL